MTGLVSERELLINQTKWLMFYHKNTPFLLIVGLAAFTHTEKIRELHTSMHVGNGVGCPWAAHGNFAMQIKLPTTSIYGNSGQLSGQPSRQPTASKYKKWAAIMLLC